MISYHFKYFTMKKSTYYLILAFVTLILSSCTTTLYVPNAVNTPLLKEKHEFKATIGPNNAQAAFGLTDNFGIIANGYWDKFKSETTTNGQTTQTLNKGNLYELGLGYYKPSQRSSYLKHTWAVVWAILISIRIMELSDTMSKAPSFLYSLPLDTLIVFWRWLLLQDYLLLSTMGWKLLGILKRNLKKNFW